MSSKYGLKVSPEVKKYFKKLRDRALKDKFKDAVTQIQLNPYEIGEAKLGDLAGIYGYDIKHKGTDFEIAYTIQKDEDGNLVLVILAGTREQFYRELKRYMKGSKIHKKWKTFC